MEIDTSHQATLAALQEDFPAYRIWLETTLTGPRYIARSRHLNHNPHTLITRDPAELRAELSAATHPPANQPTGATTQPVVPLPRRQPA
jgi:hypothetical protein